MKKNKPTLRVPKRILVLRNASEAREVTLVCTEETRLNFYGHHLHHRERAGRFPKQFWEVLSDKA